MMRGHVPTPEELTDHIVGKLFTEDPPNETDRILYPGCGTGPFIGAVERYCETHDVPVPKGIAIELNPEHLASATERYDDARVTFHEQDFLADEVSESYGEFDYIVGNPPYVPIEALDEDEKEAYRARFETAEGRFDLFVLFFERAMGLLAEEGRLVFITPEKFEYTETTASLRQLLATHHITKIEHVAEDAFDELITFPTITTVVNDTPGETHISTRGGDERTVTLPRDGTSWAPAIRGGAPELDSGVVLGDICQRISCGVATGADNVFVVPADEVPPQLEEWTYPTTSGKQLRINDGPDSGDVFISPYREDGRLVAEANLGPFGDWATLHEDRLKDRSCYQKEKRVWYAWHENPPMQDILQPKLLCKDITDEPQFWIDGRGDVVPRHSVYYLIPEGGIEMDRLQEYLNGPVAQAWLEANCQRAANGYLRMQSTVLKQLPVPDEFGDTRQTTLSGHT